MEWLCDKDRCYRTARLVILSDGRRRPRCEAHRRGANEASEYDRITQAMTDAQEKQKYGKSMMEAMVKAWSSRYHLPHNLPPCEHCVDGVKPKEIPTAKDGEALFTAGSAAGYVKKWPEGNAAGGVYEPVKVDFTKPAPDIHVGKDQKCGACLSRLATCIVDVNGSQHQVCAACSMGIAQNAQVEAAFAEAIKPAPIDRTLLDASTRKAVENIEKPAPRFKVGQWVRVYGRMLGTVVSGPHRTTGNLEAPPSNWVVSVVPASPLGDLSYNERDLEPALPRAGEWWEKKACSNADHSGWDLVATKHYYIWPQSALSALTSCGCLAPVNFGRGEAK